MRANYFYNSQPISRQEFENVVPKNWIEEIDEFGVYSYGYYKVQVLFYNGIEY